MSHTSTTVVQPQSVADSQPVAAELQSTDSAAPVTVNEIQEPSNEEETQASSAASHEVNVEDSLDLLFGDIDISRITHVYGDGVGVDIFSLGVEETPVSTRVKCYNGARVFYTTSEEGARRVLCRFPGYTIEKHVIATNDDHSSIDDTSAGIDEALSNSTREDVHADRADGTLCLTNDGPLILVFKIAGLVRLQLMRSAAHGFDNQFIDDFTMQYDGWNFDDLFSTTHNTSSVCHLFRQGTRASAMCSPQDDECRTLLYLGAVLCSTPGGSTVGLDGIAGEAPRFTPNVSTLYRDDAIDILRNFELGLICYRHYGGEVQLLSESYLLRVATMTGVPMDDLIGGIKTAAEADAAEIHAGDGARQRQPVGEEYRIRPKIFTQISPVRYSARLSCSRFPRALDLFALYVLCGTNTTRRQATVSGFYARLDSGGRIFATPKRGFYNYCRAAGVNPRRELPFPATPSAMRLAIRRIVLSATLPSRAVSLEIQFDEYEDALSSLVPMLVSRVLNGSRTLASSFESAFGITASDIVSGFSQEGGSSEHQTVRRQPSLRNVRSALLLCDHYRLVTLARFAMRYLIHAEFTPNAMREPQLIEILSDFSNSSRRRRAVSEVVASANAESFPQDDESEDEISPIIQPRPLVSANGGWAQVDNNDTVLVEDVD